MYFVFPLEDKNKFKFPFVKWIMILPIAPDKYDKENDNAIY